MLIHQRPETENALRGQTVLLTGGGGGIGLETAKALAFMGANVVLAEQDAERGRAAEQAVAALYAAGTASFYEVDLLETEQVEALCDYCLQQYGGVDSIINNATITPFGAVEDLPAYDWDVSYALHIRAPVLMLKKLLPGMRSRNRGAVVFIPSSGAAPFMGAYEVFKTAQVDLANTLVSELEGSGVYAWCVGPGLVKTQTAMEGIQKVSAWMGITTNDFYAMLESNTLTAEQAGTGIALSLLQAKRNNGRETGAAQILMEAGLAEAPRGPEPAKEAAETDWAAVAAFLAELRKVFEEQYAGWLARNVFERQWVLRNFKKITGHAADEMQEQLTQAVAGVGAKDPAALPRLAPLLRKLHVYYANQYGLLQGYEKDPGRLKEHSEVLQAWMRDIDHLLTLLGENPSAGAK